MIQFAHAPPCGTAALLMLRASEAPWRLVRKFDTAPVDADDGEVRFAGDEPGELGEWLDYSDLINGRETFYQLFSGADWQADGEPKSVIPAYLNEPLFASPDFAGFVRNRIESCLAAEVQAGTLNHVEGYIPVLTAYPQEESVRFPVVTVVLSDRRAEVRGVGEHIIPDAFDGDDWSVYQGWMDRSTLEIAVWAKSHADRVRLRDAVQRAMMLNLPLLAAENYDLPEISERDTQDFESYGTPMWQTIFTLSALHPALVRTQYEPIRTVEVEPDGERANA